MEPVNKIRLNGEFLKEYIPSRNVEYQFLLESGKIIKTKEVTLAEIFEEVENKWYSPRAWRRYLTTKYRSASTALKGRSNYWVIGRTPPTKGKTYDEYFGKERSSEIRRNIGEKSKRLQQTMSEDQRIEKSKKLSEALKGRKKLRTKEGILSYHEKRFGKSIHTEESKRKIREKSAKTLQEKPELRQIRAHPGKDNGMYGKSHTKESRKKMSDSLKAKYRDDPEYRDRVRAAGAKGWHAQNGRKSVPEQLTEDFLVGSGIKDFQYNYTYGFYCYDFYIESLQVFIEVQGDYWHGNPLVFPILNKAQIKSKTRDKQKNTFAINRGFKVYYIWETNIRKGDFSELKEIVDEYNTRRNN